MREGTREITSWWVKLCSDGALWHWCQDQGWRPGNDSVNLSPSFLLEFCEFPSAGKDFITLEEAKSNLYTRELWLKASRNSDEAFVFLLSMTDYARVQKKKKGKGIKKSKVDPKDICNYCKEPSHWKKDCSKKRKTLLLPLFRIIPHQKIICFWVLVNNYKNILKNGYSTQAVLIICVYTKVGL